MNVIKLIKNYQKNHFGYFKRDFLNYSDIRKDCRTNIFLENYNGYIKLKLDKHRLVNWVNFIEFIKQESGRNIDKLLKAANTNLTSAYENKLNNTLKYAIKNEKKINEINIEKKIF